MIKNFSLIPEYQKGLISEEIVEKCLKRKNYSFCRLNNDEKSFHGVIDFVIKDNFFKLNEFVSVSFQSLEFDKDEKFQVYTFPKKQIELYKKSLNNEFPILNVFIVDEERESIFHGCIERIDLDNDFFYNGFDDSEYVNDDILPFDVEKSDGIYRCYDVKRFFEVGKIDFNDLERLRLVNFSKSFKKFNNSHEDVSVKNLISESHEVISKYLGIKIPDDLLSADLNNFFECHLEQKLNDIPTCFFYEIYHAIHNINMQTDIQEFAIRIYKLLDEIKYRRQKYSEEVKILELKNSAEKIYKFKAPNDILIEVLEVNDYNPKFFVHTYQLGKIFGEKFVKYYSPLSNSIRIKSKFYKLLNWKSENNSVGEKYITPVNDVYDVVHETAFNRVYEISKYESAIKFLNWWKEIKKDYFGKKSDIEFLPEKYSEYFWKKIFSSEPTDIVIIRSEEERINLFSQWNTDENNNFQIPADIFLDETIPIYDFVLKYLDNFNEKIKLNPIYRIIVFRGFENQLYKSDDENFVFVGTIIASFYLNSKLIQIANPFSVDKNNLTINNEPFIFCHGITSEKFDKIPSFQFNFLIDSFKNVLIDWYGTEHALLNPLTIEQFRNRRKENINSSNVTGYKFQKNNQIAYIKRIPIIVDDLIVGESKKYERHADKWGVLGHWRNYSNGKKSWIEPYEKGPKRGQKLEDKKQRERIIITE